MYRPKGIHEKISLYTSFILWSFTQFLFFPASHQPFSQVPPHAYSASWPQNSFLAKFCRQMKRRKAKQGKKHSIYTIQRIMEISKMQHHPAGACKLHLAYCQKISGGAGKKAPDRKGVQDRSPAKPKASWKKKDENPLRQMSLNTQNP